MAAKPPQVVVAPPYADLPEVSETFADSVRAVIHDGQVWRIEFTVTRFDVEKMLKGNTAIDQTQRRFPSCRLVLTIGAGLDLLNQLTQNAESLEKQGVLKKEQIKGPTMVMPDPKERH